MEKVQNSLISLRLMIHFPTSSGVSERASKQMSAAEGASEKKQGEAIEWAVQVNQQTDKWVAQYLHRGSQLFWTIVDR